MSFQLQNNIKDTRTRNHLASRYRRYESECDRDALLIIKAVWYWRELPHFCRDKTRLLSRQKHACRDKTFGATSTVLLRQNPCDDKRNFVETKLTFVATKHVFCRDKHVFVATNTCFRDKTFVATKITLAAAPASDSLEMWRNWQQSAAVDPTRCKPRYCCFHAFPRLSPLPMPA